MTCFAKFLAARLQSFGFAIAGLLYALKTEGNMRVHFVATILVISFGFGAGVTPIEWIALVGAVGLVWMAELLNTALELICDLVEPNRSENVRRIKDIAAGAVLAAALAAAVIGALVFWPYVFR